MQASERRLSGRTTRLPPHRPAPCKAWASRCCWWGCRYVQQMQAHSKLRANWQLTPDGRTMRVSRQRKSISAIKGPKLDGCATRPWPCSGGCHCRRCRSRWCRVPRVPDCRRLTVPNARKIRAASTGSIHNNQKAAARIRNGRMEGLVGDGNAVVGLPLRASRHRDLASA